MSLAYNLNIKFYQTIGVIWYDGNEVIIESNTYRGLEALIFRIICNNFNALLYTNCVADLLIVSTSLHMVTSRYLYESTMEMTFNECFISLLQIRDKIPYFILLIFDHCPASTLFGSLNLYHSFPKNHYNIVSEGQNLIFFQRNLLDLVV